MARNPPDGYHTFTPQTIVDDARETLGFVTDVLDGAISEIFEDDGRVIHAEVLVGDSKIMVASASSEFGVFPLMTNVYVDDVDETYRRALEHGATSIREPENQFYGDRSAGVIDGQGNQWWIATHIEDVSPEEMQSRMSEMSG